MSSDRPEIAHWNQVIGHLRRLFAQRFSLLSDKADDATIERRIREAVELVGATPWILVFAIFVASVGLNVNSTAVIIGAMLISPLMGPIMGAGLGVAIYDFALVKKSLFNLAIATTISLLVSSLYFALSPLQEAQSELLARTAPTLWDVLIAMFGGFAGIIGVTREERSNVVPGVAIATALMPPVCTAGFGIAHGEWTFVAGALYLYTINCVFIALAAIAGIRILRLKRHGFENPVVERRVKLSLLILVLGTTVPSGYLAVRLVKAEYFKSRARSFVAQEFSFGATHVAETNIDARKRVIELTLIGEPLGAQVMTDIEARLSMARLDGTRIVIHQMGSNQLDVTALRSSLLSDLYRESQQELRKKDEQVQSLQKQLEKREALFLRARDIADELRAQNPDVTRVFVSEGIAFQDGAEQKQMQQLSVISARPLAVEERKRIDNWFRVRTRSDDVLLQFESGK